MVKNGAKHPEAIQKAAAKVLITQPKPENDKSPYFDLAKKHRIELVFYPFIRLEPIAAREFRKQKVEIANFSGVIFTSRNAIDHFFRMCDEMKVTVVQETKYFCITESVALYLQKFILYRKRRVFYGADSTNKSLFDAISKHKDNGKFLYVCSENQQDSEIVTWLKKNRCEFQLAFMYRSVSNDVKEVMKKQNFDVICFFTPSGVKSLLDSYPSFRQNGTRIGTFGSNTLKAVEKAGFHVEIQAPLPQIQSMAAALDIFLSPIPKKKRL